jgi:hypothetical protein
MTKFKTLMGLALMVAVLAVSAAPASALWSSTLGKLEAGQTKAPKGGSFTSGLGSISCEGGGAFWKIRKAESKQEETLKGGHLNFLVETYPTGKAGHKWGEKCTATSGTIEEISACELQLEQKAGQLTNLKSTMVSTSCTAKANGCLITFTSAENANLGKTTLTTSGTNQKDSVEIKGIKQKKTGTTCLFIGTESEVKIEELLIEGATAA